MSERSTTALCGCERERDSWEDQEPIWRDELTYSCTVDSLRRCSGWFLASGGNPNGATDSDGTGEGYLYGGSTHLRPSQMGVGCAWIRFCHLTLSTDYGPTENGLVWGSVYVPNPKRCTLVVTRAGKDQYCTALLEKARRVGAAGSRSYGLQLYARISIGSRDLVKRRVKVEVLK